MSIAALVKKDERADPRAEVRRAIADAQRARAAVDRQHDAIERAANLAMVNRGKLTAATKAVATARAEDIRQLAQSIAGGGTTSPRQAPAAEAAAREAQADVEAARAAHEQLEGELKDVELAAARAGKAVDAALAAMLEPLARRMLEAACSHRLRFLTAQAALSVLGRLWDPWTEISKTIDRTAGSSDADTRVSIATRQQWVTAVEALKMDADAKLPSLGD
jgi:hypothetical protein